MQLSKHSVIRRNCPQIVLGWVVLNSLEKDEKHQSKDGSPWYYSNTNKNDRRKAQVTSSPHITSSTVKDCSTPT